MAELKTRKNQKSVEKFLSTLPDSGRRQDAGRVLALMEKVTGEKAAMWGESMVGFGSYHYKYESGREGDWFLTGFSPRKSALTLYFMSGFTGHEALLDRLGKHRRGKSCLYIKRLEEIDMQVLGRLIQDSVARLRCQERPESP